MKEIMNLIKDLPDFTSPTYHTIKIFDDVIEFRLKSWEYIATLENDVMIFERWMNGGAEMKIARKTFIKNLMRKLECKSIMKWSRD